eukprot:NODE_7978_length_1533_cov_4.652205.p2 GENE.NODE_7978_length_1533_cov_4.652205~~NODE_7978_length_1533_cov_4.652205.p2  ORF type:complete len:317 (-),score=104.64 NODE_7978_length_1533_cov_4.652205:151-1101(-)
MPFQQLMSVLPPASSSAAGIPPSMIELMKQTFSPIIDFYPMDFGLDLNGKRYTWQAVILLPFIDEPRLVRILAPLLKMLTAHEKVRNRRANELIFAHKTDKALFHCVQLAQAAYEAGQVGVRHSVQDASIFGTMEGYVGGGMNRTITSPIEGLPDVEESDSISAIYYDPPMARHISKMLPGISEAPVVINASDLDEQTRMKGFGGEPARRMILQALGKDPDAKVDYNAVLRSVNKPQGAVNAPAAKKAVAKYRPAKEPRKVTADDAVLEVGEDDAVPAAPSQPPPGTKVIRIRGAPNKPEASQAAKPTREDDDDLL